MFGRVGRTHGGSGEFSSALDARIVGEVCTAIYFDVLSRWAVADGRRLFPMLEKRLVVVLDGLTAQ